MNSTRCLSLQYNMMYMLRQINGLFKRTFYSGPGNFSDFEDVSDQSMP